MSDNFTSTFNGRIDILGQSLSKSDLTLSDKTTRMWLEITSDRHQFDLIQQQLNMLGNLTVQNFQKFYRELIVEHGTRRKLVVVVYGHGKAISMKELSVDCMVLYDQLDQTKAELPCS